MKLNTKYGLLMTASSILGIVIFIVMSLIIGDMFDKGYAHQDLNKLGGQIVEEAEQAHSDASLIIHLLERTVSEHPLLNLDWVTDDGSIVYSTNGRTENYTFKDIANHFLLTPLRLWLPGLDITLVFTWEINQQPQYLILHVPDEAMQSSQIQFYIKDNRDFFFLILPFLLFLATPYFISFLFFLRINHRIKKLTSAMNDVDAEKSGITVKDRAKDEIGQLTRHFNSMSERISKQVAQIQEYERDKKTLIANLSHDLRTPMTNIQGYAETLQEELDDNAKEYKTYVDIILRHAHYMDKLLQKLLEISNLDSRKGRLALTESDVTEHVRKIIADFVPILESKAIAFDIHIPEQPIYALTDAYMFERAIRNVIENALQYGSSGHYLGLSMEHSEDKVMIRITDNGPGIPKDQIPFVFERFYRGSTARSGSGMGIGLYIVKEIMEAHNGIIEVQSVEHEYTVFTITLPKHDRP